MAKKRKFRLSPVAKAEKYTKELINGEKGRGDNKQKLTDAQTSYRIGYRNAVNDQSAYRTAKRRLARRKKMNKYKSVNGQMITIHLKNKPKRKGKRYKARRRFR